MDGCTNDDEFVSALNEVFSEQIPFNEVLGLKIEWISYERVQVSLRMRNHLMGHSKRRMLHGGAISTVIDQAGGLCAFMSLQKDLSGETLKARLEIAGRVSTIDLRVDFLRPGVGKRFVATAYLLRTGKKIAVTRIELHNDQNDLIAVGTASYGVA